MLERLLERLLERVDSISGSLDLKFLNAVNFPPAETQSHVRRVRPDLRLPVWHPDSAIGYTGASIQVIVEPMIDQEIARLGRRMEELTRRLIPELESKTETLYAHIMPLEEGSDAREKLEHEFNLLSKELRLRSDELIEIRRQIQRLELQRPRQRR